MCGEFNRFPDFFVQVFKIVVGLLKIQYVIVIHGIVIQWQTIFYDFRFE